MPKGRMIPPSAALMEDLTLECDVVLDLPFHARSTSCSAPKT
jgi:hypothetical protein